MKKTVCLSLICGVLFFSLAAYAEISHSPRQTGEEVLIELLMGPGRFIASVGSNGCTEKGFFKVEVKKEEGLSIKTPHYVLTIVRIMTDDCKAIVDGGTPILFDLEKDLGIRGDYTYSITNQVFSSAGVQSKDDSLWSIVEKYFTAGSSEKINEF
ncbi:MAG: hypothetical protein JW925_07770 [Syntrophaceae bacterium]|nr:hypothetical protein [Syntrophaceae bacterium]